MTKQPQAQKGKKGVHAFLKDTTNLEPPSKRRCASKASSNIFQLKKYAPRGNPSVSGSNRAKAIKKCKLKAGQQKEAPEFQTLQQIIIHDKQIFDNGFQCVDNFIERNASMEMHKAIATQVFSTAIMFKYSHSS